MDFSARLVLLCLLAQGAVAKRFSIVTDSLLDVQRNVTPHAKLNQTAANASHIRSHVDHHSSLIPPDTLISPQSFGELSNKTGIGDTVPYSAAELALGKPFTELYLEMWHPSDVPWTIPEHNVWMYQNAKNNLGDELVPPEDESQGYCGNKHCCMNPSKALQESAVPDSVKWPFFDANLTFKCKADCSKPVGFSLVPSALRTVSHNTSVPDVCCHRADRNDPKEGGNASVCAQRFKGMLPEAVANVWKQAETEATKRKEEAIKKAEKAKADKAKALEAEIANAKQNLENLLRDIDSDTDAYDRRMRGRGPDSYHQIMPLSIPWPKAFLCRPTSSGSTCKQIHEGSRKKKCVCPLFLPEEDHPIYQEDYNKIWTYINQHTLNIWDRAVWKAQWINPYDSFAGFKYTDGALDLIQAIRQQAIVAQGKLNNFAKDYDPRSGETICYYMGGSTSEAQRWGRKGSDAQYCSDWD